MRSIAVFAACVALAGCAGWPANDTAQMPHNAQGGPALSANEAIALASWALKDPANTAGKPELAARAIAAEDWLAGQTMLPDQFGSYAPDHEVPWTTLRHDVRAAIGVAPGTPSQAVVDHLLATAKALHDGHTGDAMAQLQPPAFALGPQATLAALSNLPAFPSRELAFDDLARHENHSFGGCGFMHQC